MVKVGSSTSWLALSSLFCALAATPPAQAGDNPHFTIPLHAKASQFEQCTGYLPVNCLDVRPTVEIPSGQQVTVFVLVRNYTMLAGVQTAFEVDPSWTYFFSLWRCQPGGGPGPPTSPVPPFGPIYGQATAVFECVTGGELLAIGQMYFISGQGCVGQVQTSAPSGICALDCDNEIDQILPGEEARLGRVCVGSGGRDACEQVVPVASATWGLVKATYR
jgi:hypothetical protein